MNAPRSGCPINLTLDALAMVSGVRASYLEPYVHSLA